MISVRDLSKNFGIDTALSDVNFIIEDGRAVAVFGKSGAGKSTVLEILSGSLTEYEGQVNVFGYDMAKRPRDAKKFIGFMPGGAPNYPELTVEEFLRFVGEAKGVRGKELAAQIDEFSRFTGIHDYLKTLCINLDASERKLLGIAQAMLAKPKVIILDEPAGGVVGDKVAVIHSVLRRIKKLATLIIGTANLREVDEICERVLVMNNGRIVVDDSIAHIKSAANEHSRVRVRLEAPRSEVINILSALEGVEELLDVTQVSEEFVDFLVVSKREVDLRAHIWRAASINMIPVLEMRQVTISIDEMLLQLTGERSSDALRY